VLEGFQHCLLLHWYKRFDSRTNSLQGIKRKIAASGKVAASAITSEPKGKKMKVLTHRPRCIEPAVIPEFGEGISSATKAKETIPIM
jgi:hypothetical protein